MGGVEKVLGKKRLREKTCGKGEEGANEQLWEGVDGLS